MSIDTNVADMWERVDSFVNSVLGIGGVKDPSAYTRFTKRPTLTDETLEALYIEDHFAAKIVETLPKHGLRPGWDLQVPGDPTEAALVRDAYKVYEERIGVAGELSLGACWGRVFGGAITWIGADDARPHEQPLDEENISAVRWLHTFDRRDVQIATYYQDPKHPRFRRPEIYRVQPRVVYGVGGAFGLPSTGGTPMFAGGKYVHETRIIRWGGQPTTDNRRIELAGWDDSILERCWEALKQLGEDYGAKSLLLGKISQAVYKLKNLYKMIAEKQEETLRRRMSLLDASRSRAKAIAIDTEEDFRTDQQSVAGVPDVIDRSALRVSASGNMPATLLMGQAPAGEDATGESDLEVWATEVDAWRELELRPRHERLGQLILLAKDGPTLGVEPAQWSMLYRALRVPKAKEAAETAKLWADTDAVNIDKGIYSAEVAAFRYAPGRGAAVVLDQKELEEKLERRKELAKQPPKDNAELGTVGARDSALQSLQDAYYSGRLPEEAALARLELVFRFGADEAKRLIAKPVGWSPAPKEGPGTPGPAPAPKQGEGAGAPQGLPGFNDGGA